MLGKLCAFSSQKINQCSVAHPKPFDPPLSISDFILKTPRQPDKLEEQILPLSTHYPKHFSEIHDDDLPQLRYTGSLVFSAHVRLKHSSSRVIVSKTELSRLDRNKTIKNDVSSRQPGGGLPQPNLSSVCLNLVLSQFTR